MEPVIALYAEDAVHRSAPFRREHRGIGEVAAYFRESVADETAPAKVWFADPIVAGDLAVMEWWAQVTEAEGPTTIAGIAVAEFGPDGRVVASRDYWHAEAGHREPF
jgi:hypothetical protein